MSLLALLPCLATAQTQTSSDLTVTGQLGVGTAAPRARLEAQMSASDSYGLLVSSANGQPMLQVDRAGQLGIGVTPQGRVDVFGSGDNGSVGMRLRVGNSTSTMLSEQITFGPASSDTYRHAIVTRHTASQNYLNAMDFLLWNTTAQPTAIGSFDAMSLTAISTYSFASVHILPAGDPDVELEVSNGLTTGGGSILRAAATSHSSRVLKTDIKYFGADAPARAAADVQSLRHVLFRYRGKDGRGAGPVHRGLIYEEAPVSIQAADKTIAVDYRLLNIELALREADRRIAALQKQINTLENQRRKR